jgi:hypothetical protein
VRGNQREIEIERKEKQRDNHKEKRDRKTMRKKRETERKPWRKCVAQIKIKTNTLRKKNG